jgi:hypothetical protein
MSVTILKGLHRRVLGISRDDQIVSSNGFVSGGDGKPSLVHPAPETTAVYEDFHSALIQAVDTGVPLGVGHFRQVTGDTGHGSLNIAGTNGVFRLFNTPSITATLVAASGKGVSGALAWKGNQGPNTSGRLRFGARVKLKGDDADALSQATDRMHVFVGFTDIATFEYPAFDTGAGVISAADDFLGFMYSPNVLNAAGTQWVGVSGRATADQTQPLGVGPTANTYDVLEVEYIRNTTDAPGRATFFVNGQAKGTISAPITPTVALAPCAYAFQQDTGNQALDIDYINVSAPRDTGL